MGRRGARRSPPAQVVPLRDVGDLELAAISRRFCLTLDGEEMGR